VKDGERRCKGKCGEQGAWVQELSHRLNLPVERVESDRGIGAPGQRPFSPVVLSGLALGGLGDVLDISPHEVRAQVSHRRHMSELVVASLLLVGVLGLGYAGLAHRVARQQDMAHALQAAISERDPVAKRLKEDSRSSEMMAAVLEDRRRVAQILSEVLRGAPESLAFESIVMERRERTLALRGRTQLTQTVLDFAKALEGVEGVEAVVLNHSTRRATADGERIDFELTLRQQEPSS
jgi:Tfp pilus assembly protein PilN